MKKIIFNQNTPLYLDVLKYQENNSILADNGFTYADLKNRMSFIPNLNLKETDLEVAGCSENVFLMASYNKDSQCTDIFLQNDKDIVHVTSLDEAQYNNRPFSEFSNSEHNGTIFLCDNPLTAVEIESTGQHSIYVEPENIEKFCEYIKDNHSYRGTAFVITSDSLNEITTHFTKSEVICTVQEIPSTLISKVKINNAVDAGIVQIDLARKQYTDNESNSGNFEDFISYVESDNKVKVRPTYFSKLDNLLDGGLRTGLIIVGAVSSLGKTTFTLQLADQIAKHGEDLLFSVLRCPEMNLLQKV